MSKDILKSLSLPVGKKNLLLHSCCAPCSGDIMKRLLDSNINYTVYFYNPNIHPHEEYLLRKEENMSFSIKYNIPFIDADYNPRTWFKITKGMEMEPERGKRCSTCFDMRFVKTAEYASQNGFDIISSTLGISRWKDIIFSTGGASWPARKARRRATTEGTGWLFTYTSRPVVAVMVTRRNRSTRRPVVGRCLSDSKEQI